MAVGDTLKWMGIEMADIVSYVIGAIGIVIGIGGVVYAVNSNKDRAKLEGNVQSTIEAISESMERIGVRSDWAKKHFDGIVKESHEVAESENKNRIVEHASQGRGDSTAIVDAHYIIQKQIGVLLAKAEKGKAPQPTTDEQAGEKT